VLSYFTIDDPTGERRTARKIMQEATAINNKVKEAADIVLSIPFRYF